MLAPKKKEYEAFGTRLHNMRNHITTIILAEWKSLQIIKNIIKVVIGNRRKRNKLNDKRIDPFPIQEKYQIQSIN